MLDRLPGILSNASFRKQPLESSLSKAASRKLILLFLMYCTQMYYTVCTVQCTLKPCITGAGHKLRAMHIDNKHKQNNLNIQLIILRYNLYLW